MGYGIGDTWAMTFNNFPTVRRPNSFTIEEASFYAGFFFDRYLNGDANRSSTAIRGIIALGLRDFRRMDRCVSVSAICTGIAHFENEKKQLIAPSTR